MALRFIISYEMFFKKKEITCLEQQSVKKAVVLKNVKTTWCNN